MSHRLVHDRRKEGEDWVTHWKCLDCSREYEYGSDWYRVINKGEQLTKHYGFASTEAADFGGFVLSDIDSEKHDPRLDVFEDFIGRIDE